MQVLWLSFYFPGPVAVGTPTQTSYSTHHMDGPTYFLQSGNWSSKCRLWYKKICCISLVVDWYMSGIWLVHVVLAGISFWGQLLVRRVFECILVLVAWCIWLTIICILTRLPVLRQLCIDSFSGYLHQMLFLIGIDSYHTSELYQIYT